MLIATITILYRNRKFSKQGYKAQVAVRTACRHAAYVLKRTGTVPVRLSTGGLPELLWNSFGKGRDGKNGFLTLSEAATLLGVSDDAVRKRLKSGSLRGQKVGKRCLIDPESVKKPSGNAPDTKDLLIGELQEHIRFLKEQVTVKDEQLARLLTDVESWREQVRYKELQLAQV